AAIRRQRVRSYRCGTPGEHLQGSSGTSRSAVELHFRPQPGEQYFAVERGLPALGGDAGWEHGRRP
ncbi:unnamed protein product, partial [Ascophyllum nodosum]